jgi:hypothetical protein
MTASVVRIFFLEFPLRYIPGLRAGGDLAINERFLDGLVPKEYCKILESCGKLRGQITSGK